MKKVNKPFTLRDHLTNKMVDSYISEKETQNEVDEKCNDSLHKLATLKKSMKKIYIATVQIAVEADSVDEACQAVGATLTENMMQENFIDWRYNPIEGVSHDPIFAGEFDTTRLREGEIFKNPTNA